MAKLIEKTIHEATTLPSKGHFIHPENFRKRLKSSGLDFIIVSERHNHLPISTGNHDIRLVYNVQGVTLIYFYSPGVEGFDITPEKRETITVYGSEENISNLEEKLALKAGINK